MIFTAAKFVDYPDIPAYLSLGWVAPEPITIDHHYLYGITMLWLCDCPPPFFRRTEDERSPNRYDTLAFRKFSKRGIPRRNDP
jgi:hypothetical protein